VKLHQETTHRRENGIKAIDERLVECKEDGRCYPNTDIIWYMHTPAKVKKD
jgi:hypothetical protein